MLRLLGQSYFSLPFQFLPLENILTAKLSQTPYLPLYFHWEAHTFPSSLSFTIDIHALSHSNCPVSRRKAHRSVVHCHSVSTALNCYLLFASHAYTDYSYCLVLLLLITLTVTLTVFKGYRLFSLYKTQVCNLKNKVNRGT